jgi:hypothetical protein
MNMKGNWELSKQDSCCNGTREAIGIDKSRALDAKRNR